MFNPFKSPYKTIGISKNDSLRCKYNAYERAKREIYNNWERDPCSRAKLAELESARQELGIPRVMSNALFPVYLYKSPQSSLFAAEPPIEKIEKNYSDTLRQQKTFDIAETLFDKAKSVSGLLNPYDKEKFIKSFCDGDFYKATLKGFDFSGLDLSKFSFSSAEISDCIFTDTRLSSTSFKNAKLDNCRFDGATIRNTSFRGAVITNPDFNLNPYKELFNFSGAILQGFDFSGLDLSGQYFASLIISECNFKDTNLTGADLTKTVIDRCNLDGTILTRANCASFVVHNSYININPDMRGINLSHLIFSEEYKSFLADKNLSGASFYNSKINNCSLEGSILTGANFRGVTIKNSEIKFDTDIKGKDLSKATLDGIDFSGLDLSGFDFSSAILKNCNFKDANLAGTDLTKAVMDRCNLDGTILTGANCTSFVVDNSYININPDMRGINLSHLIFSEEDESFLAGKNLSGASFCNSEINSCSFEGSVLSGADFMDATIKGKDFNPNPDMRNINFSNSRLQALNFASKDLTGANFCGAEIMDCNFKSADKNRALFKDVKIKHTNALVLTVLRDKIGKIRQ